MEKQKKDYKISFSEFSNYLQCPLKWYWSNAMGLPGDLSEELIFGSTMHKSIEDIIQVKMYSRKGFWEMVVKNNLKKELERIKDESFLKKFEGMKLHYVFVRQANEILQALDVLERFKEYEILHVEYKLDGFPLIEFKDIRFVFKGYIDLVLKHRVTGRILLLDWKTSKKAWDIKKKMKDNDDLFAQLALYKHFYSKKENIPFNDIDVKYYNLPREEPREQLPFAGTVNDTYMNYLLEKLNKVCTEIYHLDPTRLEKARFTKKKNFCHRCNLNNEETCNDYDEYQPMVR